MRRSVLLEKKIGQTPLEAITAWKVANPAYADMSASYAGRLDPMASGKLLVLLGDECKKQDRYTQLDKEYEIEVLLDIGSDTGDILGLVEYADTETNPDSAALRAALKKQLGTHVVPYPLFSSKTVAGKPLFMYALEHTEDTIAIPTHKETIYSIKLLGVDTLDAESLQTRIKQFLALAPKSDEPSKALGADFRIHDVRNSWQAVYFAAPERSYQILRLRVACASGTYMRTLAGRIGEALGTRALALSIHRTKIGKHWFGGFFVV